MVLWSAANIRGNDFMWEENKMHRQSQDKNKKGMGEDGRTDDGGCSFYCECGCGQELFRDARGRKRRFVLGHQVKKRSREQWDSIRIKMLESRPLCECGCGEHVRSRYAESLDTFIKHKGETGFYRFISGHQFRQDSWHYTPTALQQQAIYGTLLGDSSIVYPNSASTAPRLEFTHGKVQKEWAEYKAMHLHGMGFTIRETANAGYGERSIVGLSTCSEFLKSVYDNVRTREGKVVTHGWLDRIGEIGLCWWLCDDGSQSGNGFNIHTEGFSDDEQVIIKEWFARNYGQVTIANNAKGHKYIYVNAETMDKIYAAIKPHIPRPMRYKFLYRGLRAEAKRMGTRVRHNRSFDGELFC